MIRFKVREKNIEGISKAPLILQRNLRTGMETLGKRLRKSAESRMRKDTKESIRSLTIRVRGKGLNLNLEVYSNLIQAWIDAYGLKRGVFPPSLPGSRLYQWVQRRMKLGYTPRKSKERASRGLSHLSRGRLSKGGPVGRRGKFAEGKRRTRRGSKAPVQKSQRARLRETNAKRLSFLTARAIFEHGIKASNWNAEALEANKTRIVTDMSNAISRAVNEINRG